MSGPEHKAGELVEVEIEALDERGCGHAELGARELEVPGSFPGERARVRIEAHARHSKRTHARMHELLRAHPERRPPPCDRHQAHERGPGDRRPKPSCGGCSHMGLSLAAQREAKRAWIERAYGLVLDAPIVGGAGQGYRYSSKRSVALRGARAERGPSLILGSRAAGRTRGDHIADMRGCLVDHPKLRAAFDGLEQLVNEHAAQLELASWASGAGDLRHVWAKTDGERVLITLITHAEDSQAARVLAPLLVERGLADGVAHSVQGGSGNAIRGAGPRHLLGLERLSLRLEALELEPLELGPLGFLQPNPELAAQAYAALVEGLEAGALALDLYAGAGVTTTLLRRHFLEVVPCESYPESAARLGVEPQRSEDMLAGWLAAGRATPSCVLANPPRAGLGQQVCGQLLELGAAQLRIMSCSPKTLARDLAELEPRYERRRLLGFDTLPQTGHLELVALLELRA